MKKEDLKASFDSIKPDESAKERMLYNVLNHSKKGRMFNMRLFSIKKAAPVLALAIIVAGTLLVHNFLPKDLNNNLVSGEKNEAEGGKRYNTITRDNLTGDSDFGREDAIAPLLNQFQIDNKHYILLSDDLREEFGLPADISDGDIGEKIGTVTDGPDKSLTGCEIFKYNPAGGEEILAVETEEGFQLFKFFTFESYNNNQDEDAIEYLKLYGINKADDMAKVVFIGHSEQSKLEGRLDIIGEITDKDEIARFYNFYSPLGNSSDKYFDKLYNFKDNESVNGGVTEVEVDVIPPDYIDATEDLVVYDDSTTSNASDMPAQAEDMEEVDIAHPSNYDTGEVPGSVAPSRGSAGGTLSNSVTLRIYNQKGIYYESPYYIDFGFISRFEVNDEFAAFLSSYIK